ncbi:acyl-CoA desaturase [Actinomadura sp. 6N118]|uniref:acyl-CoA desaturase n=1 Tax=Actinomadura sp. 6N118 TaxID=3375151 RepID=UPI0037A3E243
MTSVTLGPELGEQHKQRPGRAIVIAFVIIPFVAVIATVPLAWHSWVSWHDIAIAAVMYAITGHGLTVGLHRYFTHGAFKARRPLRLALGIAGSLVVEGPIAHWVATHRCHHAFSDKEGDPHSPWRYGVTVGAVCKGLLHAHVGWMFGAGKVSGERYAPDILADRYIMRISRLFPVWAALSLALPAVAGGFWSMSWAAALSAFFWGGLVRVCVLHHLTWSINSVSHVMGARPFRTRDRATNIWPLAVLAMGEFHNTHHAHPTLARAGVDRGQLDSSARLIQLFESLGWAYDVHWPRQDRLDARRRMSTQALPSGTYARDEYDASSPSAPLQEGYRRDN